MKKTGARIELTTLSIQEYLDPRRLNGQEYSTANVHRLTKVLLDRGRERHRYALYGIKRFETIGDVCELSAETLCDMPGMGPGLESLLSRLLKADGLSLRK